MFVLLAAACHDAAPAADGGQTDSTTGDLEAGGRDAPGPREAGARAPLLRLLESEVHAYLTADDPGDDPPILARLETVYAGVSFGEVARAVRHRPPALPAPGVSQVTWTNPYYQGPATCHLYVPPLTRSPAPLLVFLHGAGGDGAGVVGQQAVREAADRLGAILAAPTSDPKCDWSALEDCMAQTVMLVQHLKRRYPVDDARVVLSGFSMGGRGAFSVGVAYPEPYCGVVPVAGTIGAVHNTQDLAVHKAYCCPHMENIGNLRLHYISGELDVPLLILQNRGCAECIKDQGSWHRYTELKGQGHVWPLDLWEEAVAWTLERPRPSHPSAVVYHLTTQASAVLPDDLWTHQKLRVPQYWADIEARLDDTKPARLEAHRAGNLITLGAKNVARVAVFLPDDVLDLDAEVTIAVEGRGVMFQGLVPRDRRFLLTEARRRSDRSMLFANRVTLLLR
jgi:predicted esterase